MTLELHATPEDVMHAVEAVQEYGQKMQLGEREIFALALALEECASNIVNHAYRRDDRQVFRVSIEHTNNTLTLELRDYGPEFDPTRACLPEAAVDEDDRPPGGWGIHLVRHYMDEIVYRRDKDENVLRLTKRLLPPGSQK